MTVYAAPGAAGAKIAYKPQYNNFIGGKFVPPVKGQYFDVISPVNGKVYTQAARSTAEDIELALDAAHAAADAWGKTDAATRANILLKIADRIEQNLELLAFAETVDIGKAIRETLNADIPLTVDHFRYFAGCVRAQEGALSNIDENTVAYHIQEPLGVVGQIIPWNFPILMAAWKLAPAIGAGNCVVLKPAESTPISILILAELIADLLPPGVLNIVNGYGREAGMPLATSKRIAKIAYKPQYNNFIGGKFVPPVKGQYFDVISPVNGKVYTGRPLHRRRHRAGAGRSPRRRGRLGQDRRRHTRQHPAENRRPH